MRRFLAVAALFGVLATSADALPKKHAASPKQPVAAAEPTILYDFKGAKLGMTLEEWRALPSPAILGGATVPESDRSRPVCKYDPNNTGEYAAMYLSMKGDDAAHVVPCKYGFLHVIEGHNMWTDAQIPIGDSMATDVEYRFVDGKLYQILVWVDTSALQNVMDGLTAKWGQPSSVVNDTVPNKLGMSLPHTIKIWQNPAASIRLETPFSRIDNLMVTYESAEGARKVQSILQSISPDADKM
jgi:hypothetical protein